MRCESRSWQRVQTVQKKKRSVNVSFVHQLMTNSALLFAVSSTCRTSSSISLSPSQSIVIDYTKINGIRTNNEEMIRYTALVRRTSARICAPWFPILHSNKLRIRNVYIEKINLNRETTERKKMSTLLFRKASAKY